MTERFEFDGLDEQLESLEKTFDTTRSMAAAFDLELVRMRDSLTLTSGEVGTLSRSIGRGLRGAFDGLVTGGIEGLIQTVVPFANGGSFTQGRVMPFANGGIVSGATLFPMRGGTGLMGEAGPEAIMPLSRGADGRLGVRSEGGGRPMNITMNISTPDVQGFQRSQSQIAAEVSRMLSRGQRNN